MTTFVLGGIWNIVIRLYIFLKKDNLKPDYSGECLNSTDEGEKEDNDTFSSNL